MPHGLSDRLPGKAAIATRTMRAVLDTMHAHGYDRVSPPLIEFEHALAGRLAKSGEADAGRRMFRFVDPGSLRSLAIRSDMTVQLGRIAATSLGDAPRPLRLCYAGEIAVIEADQLDPARQRLQMGAELIGNDTAAAASEILALAIEALTAAGATGISVDFTMPDLVDVLAVNALPIAPDRIDMIRRELDTKDAGGLKAAGGEAYLPLLFATGDFETALDRLRSLDIATEHGDPLGTRIAGLKAIASRIEGLARTTLDPTERHGFEYQSWFGFTIFADNVRGALGRGGTYTIAATGEPATGFSLYCDALNDVVEPVDTPPMVYCPVGHDRTEAAELRKQGYRTIEGLEDDEAPDQTNVTHILTDKGLREITN